jgi:hypothetical protein
MLFHSVLLLLGGCCAFEIHHGHETAQDYSNEWIVRLEGGPEVAESLALQLGYEFLGSVSCVLSHYKELYTGHEPALLRNIGKCQNYIGNLHSKLGEIPIFREVA